MILEKTHNIEELVMFLKIAVTIEIKTDRTIEYLYKVYVEPPFASAQ